MKAASNIILSFLMIFINAMAMSASIGTFAGSGAASFVDSTGTAAKFYYPEGIASDYLGNVYVADQYNNRIRKISQFGVVTTLAGSGVAGSGDGVGVAAQFNFPTGVAVDGYGNVYVAGYLDKKIRKISPSGVTQTLVSFENTTLAQPWGIAVGPDGFIYITSYGSPMANKITKISPDGSVITTLAGTGVAGFKDGAGSSAQFFSPCGIAVDVNNNVYVADNNNNRIRKITPSGNVTTLAGSGIRGEADGQGSTATFSEPFALSIDGAGSLFVGEGFTQGNAYRIRKISATGAVSTIVGPTFTDQTTGVSTTFRNPRFTTVAPDGTLYVSDAYRHTIYKVTGAAAPVVNP